jgi:hypothetical protein
MTMPSYALLLRDEGGGLDGMTAEQFAAHFQKFVSWAERLQAEGRLRGVERLEVAGARTVRRRGGALVVDGPYVEGKEAVLGFYLVDAADDDEAARIAADCPALDAGGSVEVRRLGDFPRPG